MSSSPLTALVEQDSRFDSNVFNTGSPASLSTDAADNRHDSYVFDTHAEVRYDLNASRQHIYGEGNVSNTDYQKFSALNYHGWRNTAGWDYAIGDNLDGNLAYTDSRSLSELNNLALAQGDLQRIRNSQASLVYQLTPNVGAMVSAGRQTTSHNQLDYLDLTADSNASGLIFALDKGERLTLRQDTSRISYRNDLYDIPATLRSFHQQTTQLILDYPYSDRLKFSISTGRSKLYQQLTNASVNSTVSAASISWQATSHILIAENYMREYDPPGLDASLTLTTSLNTTFQWRLNEHFTWNMTQMTATTHYGDLSLLGERDETMRSYRSSLDWAPSAKFLVSMYAQRRMRHSPVEENVFASSQAGINIQYRYQ